ncbi:hypothetical protein OHB41_18015 [Streptomyces sp. NBC_01571]|uniref:hypothetical protein n=1 Tax=Streptomyces sp. NBC_01571 TaxID=2975883 RepID=UPI002259DE5E|nr:hypothetical protein [Streptomyces sp. NBC_01571]MCX4575048.1 hypothetical protein [Streptomyces sp. NBC_01571]
MTAGWCSRTVRAAVFAAVCVLLAALGHVMMSGREVPPWVLGASVVVIGGTGWGLAGRERGLPLIVAAVMVTQAALHSAFSLAQASATTTPTTGTPGRGSMSGGAMTAGSMSTDAMPMGPADMDSMNMGTMGAMDHMGGAAGGASSLGMLAAHLLAALLCGLWLAHGERAAFRVLRALAARLAAPLRLLLALPAPVGHPRPRLRRHRPARAPRLLLLVHAITSRGPPAGTAVV